MKRLLYEAPVDDFLSDDAKIKLYAAQKRKYENAKQEGGSTNNMAQLMYSLPNIESQYKGKLMNLAMALFFHKFPKIKERVDKGILKLDIQFSTSPGGRITKQTVSPELIKQAKEIDPDFEERVKARNFINATTQGSSWSEGFNSYKEVESQLNQLNPELINKYKQFEYSATVFYNDNTSMLERMAEQSAGRVAFADIQPDPDSPGNWIIIVRAPHFPLLVHELYKAGHYFNSLLYMPSNKLVSNTLTKTTDSHKNEIKHMITGREIDAKLRYLYSTLIDEYNNSMEAQIRTQWNKLANDNPKLYNYIMYEGVLDNVPEAMKQFEDILEIIVDAIRKKPIKLETPDFNKAIEDDKPKEPEEDDDDFDIDDYDVYNIDDED